MKNHEVVAAAVLALATATLTLEAQGQDISVGLDVGVSLATFSGDNVTRLDHDTGFKAGLTVAWHPMEVLSLETGVGWLRKGATGTIPGSDTGFDETLLVDLDLDYLQIPVLARLQLPGPHPLTPSIFAGPALALETGCTTRTPSNEFALTLGCDSDPESRKQTDWSFVVGGGLAYRLREGTALRAEGRYDIGLTAIDELVGLDIHNRAFVVTAGFVITLGT